MRFLGLLTFLLIIFSIIGVYKVGIYKVTSGSMQNVLPVNSFAITVKTDTYAIGDVITFKTEDNEIITHRIIDIQNQHLITKGDANKYIDSDVVPITKVVGKVISVITGLELFIGVKRLWYTFYMPIGLALGIYIRTCIIAPIAHKP